MKGISAAARIVNDGGTILVASACSDGVPDHGNFAALMREGRTPADVIESVYAREPILDQWQAQILSGILDRVNVKVYTEMDRDAVRACKLQVIPDLNKAIHEHLKSRETHIALLPDGPLAIPYLKSN